MGQGSDCKATHLIPYLTLPHPASPCFFWGMAEPSTLVVRTFLDRGEALAHFFLRAGEAPRVIAFDDAVGMPMETALAALEAAGIAENTRSSRSFHPPG